MSGADQYRTRRDPSDASRHFYNSADNLQSAQLIIDDLKLISLISGSGAVMLEETSFASVTVNVQLTNVDETSIANPSLYPIPDRQTLQQKDFASSGDKLLIHDPNTGYDWLSPDRSSDMKISELMAALSSGGQYSGFRIARVSEVEQLLLNQIHAADLPAQVNDLRPRPPAHLHAAINELVDLVDAVPTDNMTEFQFGIVADKGLSYNTAPDTASTLIFTKATPSGCDCPTGGLSWRATSLATVNGEEPKAGAWLVRGSTLPERPTNRPSLFDGELLIPDVLFDGSHYKVMLRFTDEKNLVFFLAELTEIASGPQSLRFEGDPARVSIPELEIINGDGSRSTVAATLELVPDTIPPAFIATVLSD